MDRPVLCVGSTSPGLLFAGGRGAPGAPGSRATKKVPGSLRAVSTEKNTLPRCWGLFVTAAQPTLPGTVSGDVPPGLCPPCGMAPCRAGRCRAAQAGSLLRNLPDSYYELLWAHWACRPRKTLLFRPHKSQRVTKVVAGVPQRWPSQAPPQRSGLCGAARGHGTGQLRPGSRPSVRPRLRLTPWKGSSRLFCQHQAATWGCHARSAGSRGSRNSPRGWARIKRGSSSPPSLPSAPPASADAQGGLEPRQRAMASPPGTHGQPGFGPDRGPAGGPRF